MAGLSFIDAAFPGSYPAADGFCFYIGGDTPHSWTAAEVSDLKSRYRYLLPVYVRSDPPGPGAAADVAAAMARLAFLGAPAGCLVAWDSETSTDAAYIGQVYGLLALAGYQLIDYGSQDFVTGNRNPDGYYWGAQWTGVSHLAPGDQMTQYESFADFDESLASPVLPFWDTRGPVPAPPPPSPLPLWQQALLAALGEAPVLAPGSRDTAGKPPAVHLLQLLVTGRGAWYGLGPATRLAQDGDYGPRTTAGVMVLQQHLGLSADGIAGPLTFGALILR